MFVLVLFIDRRRKKMFSIIEVFILLIKVGDIVVICDLLLQENLFGRWVEYFMFGCGIIISENLD